MRSMEAAKKPKQITPRKRVGDPKGERKYLIVGSKVWNERYLEYEWKEHEFGEKRKQPLPEFMNTEKKRRETRRKNTSLYLIAKLPKTFVGCNSIIPWVCTHLLSHLRRKHVQGVDE